MTGIYLIALGFLALQLACFGTTIRYLQDQRRRLAQQGSLDTVTLETPDANDWLGWVREAFPGGSVASVGWTREDAFGVLDEILASHQGYQCLQRLGVAAPLLGVLITAFGLRGLAVPSESSISLPVILDAIRPLFSGVIVGASLAIVNQVLLQIVQWRTEVLCSVARRWFDREVWARSIATPREAIGATVAALSELAGSIRDSARVNHRSAERTRKATRILTRASRAFQGASRDFGSGLNEFASQVQGLEGAVASTRSAAEAIAPALRDTQVTLDQATSQFRKAVVDQFVPASKHCAEAMGSGRESSEKMLSVLTGLDRSVTLLGGQVETLAEYAGGMGRSGGALNQAVAKVMVPAQESLLNASQALNQAAGSLPALFQGASEAFEASADQLRSSLTDSLAPAAVRLRESIEGDIQPMVKRHGELMREAAAASLGLRTLFEQVRNASNALEDRYAHLAEAASRHIIAGEAIHESLKERLIPAHESVGRSASDLAGSAAQLSRFIQDGLNPATSALAEMGRVVGPMKEAADAIRAVGEADGRLRELASAARELREAVEAAGAIKELESILEGLSRSFAKADELRRTVEEMPELYARQLGELSREALRRQADELRDVLADIAKQFGLFAIDGNAAPRGAR